MIYSCFAPSRLCRLTVLMVLLISFVYSDSLAQSAGPNFPGTAVSTGSGQAWSNPGNVISNNGANATCGVNAGNSSRYLVASNFNFSIPVNATITGYVVEIERSATAGTLSLANMRDNVVSLGTGNTPIGNNLANGSEWPTSMSVASYGGATDLWGINLTPAQVNASNFTVVLQTRNTGLVSSTASVDFIRLTVHYTVPPSISNVAPLSMCTNAMSQITITGSNFDSVTGVSVGGVPVANYTVTGPTQITANLVASATSGPVVVTSSNGTATSSQTVNVYAPPSVSALSGNQDICVGGVTTFSSATTGGTWSVANPLIATVSSGVVTGVSAGSTAIHYTFTHPSTGCSHTISRDVTVYNVPTNITSEPVASQSVCSGTTASMSVSASGTNLTYQWYKGGTALSNGGHISGATSPTLSIGNVSPADAGTNYYCIVSGICGQDTSSMSALTVVRAVGITSQPNSLATVCPGGNAAFSIGATGDGLTYQWYNGATMLTNGAHISGATTPNLVLSNVTAAHASVNYYCVVSGDSPCLSVNSAMAQLMVVETPAITNQPVLVNTVCAGSPVGLSASAIGGGLTFQWYRGALALSDGGNLSGAQTHTLYISGATPADAANDYYLVVSNDCGQVTSSTATVLVHQTPAIPGQSAAACSGQPFSVSPSDGDPDGNTIVPSGTTYSWPAPVVTGGMTGGSAATGQSSISQTLVNPTDTVQTATYTVIPVSGTSGNCAGDPFTVTVLVHPSPVIGNMTTQVCSGENLVLYPANGSGNVIPAGTLYSWTNPVVTGGVTGGAAASGQSAFDQTLVNPTGIPQTAIYNVTATSGSCVGTTFTLLVTVYPQPAIDVTPSTQSICSGQSIAPISITNSNSIPGTTTYIWTRDNSANVSGIPVSGSGSIAGILNNLTNTPQVVNFEIQAISEEGCLSVVSTATVTVDPIPQPVASVPSQTVCSGSAVSAIDFSTSNGISGATFTWTRDNTTNLTGIAASGSGTVSGTFVNHTSIPQSTTFTVTASANGCSSTATFVIIVNPQPVISVVPSTQTICSGSVISNIIVTNTNAIGGISYSWIRSNTSNVSGIPASGTGTLISGTLNNLTGADQTVTFTVYASAGGCTSVAATSQILVRAVPAIVATPATQSICNNTSITPIAISNSNSVPGTTYTWTRNNTGNISGIAAGGSGSSISGTLTNTTTSNQITTFTITATAPNGCTSTATVSVTVYPTLTAPVVSGTQTVCAGSTPTPLTVSSLPGGGSSSYTYQWQSGPSATGPWTNITGATGLSYQPPTTSGSTPTTHYQLVTTSCGTVVSNTVAVSVANNLNFTFSTSGGSVTLCSGSPFTPTITSGEFLPDSVIRYSWTGDVNYITPVNGGPIGTTTYLPFSWLPLFSISSATLPLSVVNNTNAPVTTTVYITPLIYNAGTNQIICSLSPRAVNVTILPRPVATVTAPAPGTTICSGSSTGISISGNINSPTSYTITKTGNSGVTSSLTFPHITGNVAAGASYILNDVLTNNTNSNHTITYSIVPTSGGCTGTPTTYQITVAPRLLPGAVGPNQTICHGGNPLTINQTQAAVGGGTLTYQWFSGTSASGPWTAIGGATQTTYTPPAGLTADIWYVRQVTSTVSGITCSVQNSTPVRVSVNSATAGNITGNQTICSGSAPAAIASTANGTGAAGASVTYIWQQSTTGCSGPWTTISGATTAGYSPGALTQTTYFRRITHSTLNGVTCTAESGCVTILVNSVSGGTIAGNQTICGNNPDAFTVSVPATGTGTLSYQWQSNTTGCGGPWTNIPGAAATGATYDPPSGLAVTTFYRRVTTSVLNGVSCTSYSNCVTVTATTVTGGAISGNRTVCAGGDPAAFTETTPSTGINVTYQWQWSASGGIGSWTDIPNATSPGYDHPGPVNETIYFQRVTISNPGGATCTATSNLVAVFVNHVTPPVIAGEQNVCSGETPASFTVTTPASAAGTISYQWQRSTTGCSGPWTNISGATSLGFSPPVITQTNHYRVVVTSTMNGVSCTQAGDCITIHFTGKVWNGSVSSNWNTAANWTPSGVPSASHCVVIPNVATDPIISGSSVIGHAYNLTVLSGARLDVLPGNTLAVTNSVTVNPGGNLTLENTASLVQTDNVNNSGSVVIRRSTQPMHRFDFTYWGTPLVAGTFTLGNLSPNTLWDKYFSWTPSISGGAGNWASESQTTVMNPSKGYIVRAPQSFSTNPSATQPFHAEFVGTPNNGIISVPIAIGSLGPASSDDKLNLIGNPYASAVDADLFLSDPVNSTLIDGTIYFWTHHAPPAAAFPSPFYGTFIYNYSPNGYASYNAMGFANTVPLNYGGPTPEGYIASGQGFFVKGLANGTARFDNSMRIAGNNGAFFRTASAERHRIWLNLANNQGAFSQMLVGYAEGATDGIDRSFDGNALSGSTVSMYTLAGDHHLTIQGLALPFVPEDIIPVGYSSASAGTFTIGIDRVDGVFSGQEIYLEDRLLNVIHDLKDAEYEFATVAGTFNNRFQLRFINGTLDTPSHAASVTLAFVGNSVLYVQSETAIERMDIFDITGKKVATIDDIEIPVYESPFEYAQGIYIGKITFRNGEIMSVKLQN